MKRCNFSKKSRVKLFNAKYRVRRIKSRITLKKYNLGKKY